MNDNSDTDDGGDGEGVWSPDIEQCFREALLLFPPCGRRKHILQEEGGGKMYGRNELIARHIQMRTGKLRTRKQVSSHIQVLARRKAKAETGSVGDGAGSSSPTSISNVSCRINDSSQNSFNMNQSQGQQQSASHYDVWSDRPVVTQKIRLVEFSAFIEYRSQVQQQSMLPQAQLLVGNRLDSPSIAAGALASLATAAVNENSHVNINPMSSAQFGPQSDSSQVNVNSNVAALNSQQTSLPSPLPLTPNHLSVQPLQFNQLQASYQQNSNGVISQPLNNNHQHHLHINQGNGENNLMSSQITSANNNYHQQLTTSVGFTRHSYVKIDYREANCRPPNKLERIDISQIQDKFPEINCTDGLFQRGPSDAFFLVKFWADLNNDHEYNIEDQNSYFGFSCHFETVEPLKDITCSTKACSYGLQVVEKVEKIYGAFNSSNGRYSYNIDRSPMCEFMIQFIKKLRQLPRASQMNSVLENFTVLQVITSESTSEILLCLAYVFEIATTDQNNGSQYHVYKLTNVNY